MKDVSIPVHQVYASLLGALSYDGQSVPFYQEEPNEVTPDYYVVLQNITSTEDNNDFRFVSEAVATLEIVSKDNMRNTRSHVDQISQSILGLLLPRTLVNRFAAGFQVIIKAASTPGYLHQVDGSIHTNRKILRITNRITEI
jgi:hypothetical protein